MLEVDFNELDNDFITAWSRYLTGKDKDKAIDVIKILAERGQRDALSAYFTIFGRYSDNIKVNKLLQKELEIAYTTDFMSKIIVASTLDDDREFYPLSIKKFLLLNNEIYLNGSYSISDANVMSGEELVTRNRYGRLLYSASNNLYDKYNQTDNILYLERFLELRKQLMIHTSSRLKLSARLQLAKMYKNNPEDAAIGYALGRNLLLLSGNRLTKKRGYKILSRLAEREYSNEINLNADKPVEKE